MNKSHVTPCLIIDSQVHAYERNHPQRPWHATLEGPPQVTGDDMIIAMDKAGVDAALLVSPISLYRYDPSYALKAYATRPSRFAVIKPFNPADANVREQIEEWAATPGVVGTRVLLDERDDWDVGDQGLNHIFATSARVGLPLAVHAPRQLKLIKKIAANHPDTQVVLDHLGLEQPLAPPPPSNPFDGINHILALAELDNVVIKVSGVCTLSHKRFPYEDIWPSLLKIIESYGIERCIWGTDWTRALRLCSYEQSVDAFTGTDHLSANEITALMAGNLMRVYDWRPTSGRFDKPLKLSA